MNRVLRSAMLMLMLIAAIWLAATLVFPGLRVPQSSSIVGTWQGDATETFDRIYSDMGITVRKAHTTVTFRADGTYTSEDSATLVAAKGSRKGAGKYRGLSNGVFTFDKGVGTLRETTGDRSINGKPLPPVTLPQSVSLRLHGSTLLVTEDYGKEGRFQSRLTRR